MRLILLATFLYSTTLFAQRVEIDGTILLEDGTPAVGATIEIVDTDYATTADADGQYHIKNIKPNQYEIRVNYVGTNSFAQKIDLRNSIREMNIQLTSSTNKLGEVMVTAQSDSRIQEQQAIQIESVDIQEVRSSVKAVVEAIDQLSGVRVRTNGALGDRVDIALNGLNGTAVRMYVDGLPLEFVYPSLNLGNIPLNNVKRVDVYKGVLPVDVGTDAMGGGINIIPEYKPYNSLRASYSFGSFNTHQAGLNANLKVGEDVLLSFNGAYDYSDNDYEMNAYVWETREVEKVRRFHDDYKLLFTDLTLAINNKSWADQFRISVNYANYRKALQNGGIIGRLAYGEAIYEGANKNIFATYKKSLGKKISFSNTFAYTHEDIFFRDTTKNTYSWSGEVVTRRTAGEYGAPSLSDRNQVSQVNRTNVVIKLSDNDNILISNLYAKQKVFGRDEFKPKEKDVLTLPQFLTKDVIGIEYRRELLGDKLSLSAAGKCYFYDVEAVDIRAFSPLQRDSTTLGWYATAKYNFTPQFFVRASYEQAWRIPFYTQFFGNGNDILANPNLRPESSDNYNLGIAFAPKQQNDRFNYRLEINGFLREQSDIIFLSPNIFQQYINAEEVKTLGIEGELTLQFLKNFKLITNLTKFRKTYQDIYDNNASGQFLIGTNFPNTPNFFGNARLQYTLNDVINDTDKISIYGQFKYVDEFNFINVGQLRNDENWVPVQQRLDAGMSYSAPKNKYSISLNVNNVLNSELFDNFKIPRPGINFNVKLTYQFNNY